MKNATRYAITATLLCGLATIVAMPSSRLGVGVQPAAAQSLRLFGPSKYEGDRLSIEKAELLEDEKVEITFTTLIESAWHCPGANAKTTKQGVVLTFVRAPYNKRPKVDYPATTIENRAGKLIVVDAKGKPILLKTGKKTVQIYPPKNAN